MFNIEPIDPPEEVAHAGGIAILTHRARTLAINVGAPDAVVIQEAKGFIGASGVFQAWGPIESHTMDAQGLAEMLADTTDGKPAGVFRTTDLLPAVERRKAAKEAQKAAEEAERAARAEEERQRRERPQPAPDQG